jgi:hypothetical protein
VRGVSGSLEFGVEGLEFGGSISVFTLLPYGGTATPHSSLPTQNYCLTAG